VCGMPCLHMPTLPRTTWHGALGEVTEKFSPKIACISFDKFCHQCLAKSSGPKVMKRNNHMERLLAAGEDMPEAPARST
jgi:hypothetical protein